MQEKRYRKKDKRKSKIASADAMEEDVTPVLTIEEEEEQPPATLEEVAKVQAEVSTQEEEEEDVVLEKDLRTYRPTTLTLCVVCMDGYATHLLAPCGHQCVCRYCLPVLNSCPICRVDCIDAYEVFNVGGTV